jgi:hypothetical protein
MGGVTASYDEPNYSRGGFGATPSGGYENEKRPFNYEEGGGISGYNMNRQSGYGGTGMGARPPVEGEALEVNLRVTTIKTSAKLLSRISALIPNHKQSSMSTMLC